VPRTPTLSSPTCPGARLNWKGLFYSTYPFPIHEIPPGGKNRPGYSLHTIGKDPLAITVISDHCRGSANENRGPCSSCETAYTLVEVVQDKADRARGPVVPRGQVSLRSSATLMDNLNAEQEKVNKLKLEKINLSSMLDTARGTISEFEQLVEKISLQVGFGLATATSTLDDGILGNRLNGKRPASSPPGTPHSKAREEQQHRKSRRVAENHVDWNEDVFAT
jgi:hypothetical protein